MSCRFCRPVFSFLLFLILAAGLPAQDCPSVSKVLQAFYDRPEETTAIAASVQADCPTYLDTLSAVYHKRSVYAYSSQKSLPLAIDFAHRALATQEKLYGDSMALSRARSLANLGLFYRNDRQPKVAKRYLLAAEAAFRELDIYSRRHNNREQLTFLWQDMGDYGRAEELLQLMATEAIANENAWTGADIQRLLGRLYNKTGEYEKAITHAQAAITSFTEQDAPFWATQARIDLGNAYYHLKDYPAALRVNTQALREFRAYGATYEAALLENHLGLIELRAGKPAAAANWLARARLSAEEEKKPVLLASVLDNTAESLLAEGNAKAAVVAIREAIQQLTPEWTYSNETPLPAIDEMAAVTDRPNLFTYLGDLARALVADDQTTAAREALATADKLADQLRADYGTSVSKLFWRKEALPVYDQAFRLSRRANDLETAFYYLEKSRSILLLEALLRDDAEANLPTELSERYSQLNRQLTVLQQQLVTAEEDDKAALRSTLVSQWDSLEVLREEITAAYPQLRELLTNTPVVSLAEAREPLHDGHWDRQLTYFLGGDTAYVFSLTATEASIHSLGPTAALEASIRQLLGYYAAAGTIDKDPSAFLFHSSTVYDKLLGDLNIPPREALLIIPDGLLDYVPFSALVTEAGDSDLAGASYLLRSNPVSYAQSATILQRQLVEGIATASANAFAFCPFPEALPGIEVSPLPFSEREVDQLAGIYPTEIRKKQAAGKAALLSEMNGVAIAHLSTHAYATTSGDEPPRILTADEPVYLQDIYGLRLHHELVTLSACQSNIGPLAKGEGVLGLGRAFTAAGARGVVASLWSLNDQATAEVTSTFYERLAAGTSKPLALHQAKLAYLEREDLPAYLKSPYYWAGLTYYGDAGKLPAPRSFNLALWLALGCVALGLGLVFFSRRRTSSAS